MQGALSLCDSRGRFLFEVRPDLFPAGFLTDEELALWGRFYERQSEARK